jgi:hypothetical protein
MLLPQWQRRLEEAAHEGRELKLQTRGQEVVVIGIKPGCNQADLIEFPSMTEYVKRADEIEQFFESRKDEV